MLFVLKHKRQKIVENPRKILFIVNPLSGNKKTDYKAEINSFFKEKSEKTEVFILPKNCRKEELKTIIQKINPQKVIAVGGDGTLKLVAECLLKTNTPIGIIPAGSANGMAKELDIPLNVKDALELTLTGHPKQIHAVLINNELCIHLADIGFNAHLIKKFDRFSTRGMFTYAKAAWQTFWLKNKMEVLFNFGNKTVKQKAVMVAIANATKYGSGLQINPDGELDDQLFEVILVKEYAVMEMVKIWISKLPWNPKNIEIFQTDSLTIRTKNKVHFQVDGEYLGKVNQIEAKLIPKAIWIIV